MRANNAIKHINRSFNTFYKTSLLHKFLYFLAFLICISLITNHGKGKLKEIEGFKQKSNNFKMNTDAITIYDDFYANIYDLLVFSKIKNDFEIGHIIQYTKPAKNSNMLDIGSGTGHHVSSLVSHGYKAKGIDISSHMVKKAKETYPKLEFNNEDALNEMNYPPDTFTHITCLYFTLYYMRDKRMLFSNCMKWLLPGGYLAVHMVNRDKFDPILPAGNPFTIVSPQKFAKKRITSTIVKFDDFEYKSNFNLKDNVNGKDSPNAIMNETFKNNKDGNIVKNEHQLYMQTQSEILDIAKSVGFIIHSKIDLLKCQYENQYIYILQKPN